MRTTVLFLLALCAVPLAAQQTRPEVLVLGVFHFANPGHDLHNTVVDDVLAPKRQAEIAEVIAALKKFNPTKIAVEAEVGGDRMTKRYADYLAGKYELTRNETDQIGLRLAKELGHKTIYSVDVDGEFPYTHLVNWAKANARMKELDALSAEIGAAVKAKNDYLATHTILETLLYANADARVAQEAGWYYRQAEFGEEWDWAGADMLAEWYKRNMRIYSNVARLADAPDERILVVYGSGHLAWLQQPIAGNPRFRLRKLGEFAP